MPDNFFPFIGSAPQGALGAVLNVTATGGTGIGYLTVYPQGATLPNASNVNYGPGQTVPNLVNVGLGSDGIEIHNTSAGTVQVVVDFEGYYVPALS